MVTMYTGGDCANEGEKTEVLTIRIAKSTKMIVAQEAEKREWSTSKTAEKILTAWAQEQVNGTRNDGAVAKQKKRN